MSAVRSKKSVRPERSEAESKDGPSTSALRACAQGERIETSRVKKVGEICRLEYGSNLPERDRKPGNVPVYGSNGVVGNHDRAITHGPTIIVGRKGSIGQIAFSEVSCWPIDTTYYVDGTLTRCDLAWLSLLLRSLRLAELNKASGVPGLNRDDVYALRVMVPEPDEQRCVAARLKAQLAAIETARKAAQAQMLELASLANAIVRESVGHEGSAPRALGAVLDEVKEGVGSDWAKYRVLGATRTGLAPAKEPVGKYPERYKPVMRGSVFYNPMRILIGSIAMVDDDDEPGITSPDYVVLRGRTGEVDSRWFYCWLRSPFGAHCIASLARGAVRERMLFNRLAEGKVELPLFSVQQNASRALAAIRPMQEAVEGQLADLDALPARLLAQAFDFSDAGASP